MKSRVALYLTRAPMVGALAVVGLLAAGCGSSGSGNGGGGLLANALRVTVHWNQRSRAIDAPSSALSVIVTVTKAKSDGSDLVFVINRPANPGDVTETYGSPVAVQATTGSTLNMKFCAQLDGVPPLVGLVNQTINVTPGGDVGTFATSGTITSLALSDDTVAVGQTKDVSFTAKDANGAVVSVTPGSVLFTVQSGSDKLHIVNGQLVGVAAGAATVVGTIKLTNPTTGADASITSAPATITVQ